MAPVWKVAVAWAWEAIAEYPRANAVLAGLSIGCWIGTGMSLWDVVQLVLAAW